MKFKTIDSVERFKGKSIQDVWSKIREVEYSDEEAATILEEAKNRRVHTWCILHNVTGYTTHRDGDVIGDYVSPFRPDNVIVCDGHFCGVDGAQGAVVSMYELLLLEDGVKAISHYSAGNDDWDADGIRYGKIV